MELEIDKFYEDDRQRGKVSSPLNAKTLLIALGLHASAFCLFWIASKVMYRPKDVVIPIDMTIVPPWAEQDLNDPNPDPNPPPEDEPDKPDPKPEPEPEKPQPEEPQKEKVEAVEKIPEKPKKKEFKKGPIKKPDKKAEKPKKKEFKKGAVKKPKITPPVKLPPGKGTSRDKPLSQSDIMKALAAGARYGASNQLATSEEQRCVSLIMRRFYECWTDFSWSEGLKPVVLSVRLGSGGRILDYRIVQRSGDAKVDQSVLAAAKRVGRVPGLSADFLKRYPEISVTMTPKR